MPSMTTGAAVSAVVVVTSCRPVRRGSPRRRGLRGASRTGRRFRGRGRIRWASCGSPSGVGCWGARGGGGPQLADGAGLARLPVGGSAGAGRGPVETAGAAVLDVAVLLHGVRRVHGGGLQVKNCGPCSFDR